MTTTVPNIRGRIFHKTIRLKYKVSRRKRFLNNTTTCPIIVTMRCGQNHGYTISSVLRRSSWLWRIGFFPHTKYSSSASVIYHAHIEYLRHTKMHIPYGSIVEHKRNTIWKPNQYVKVIALYPAPFNLFQSSLVRQDIAVIHVLLTFWYLQGLISHLPLSI